MKIALQNAGRAGISVSILFAGTNDVTILDSDRAKVDLINQGSYPIEDAAIKKYVADRRAKGVELNLTATTSADKAFTNAEYIVLSMVPSMDTRMEQINTSGIEVAVRKARSINRTAWIIIQAHVPVGFTERLSDQLRDGRLLFSPDFIADERSFNEVVTPPRIVIGAPETVEARAAAGRFIKVVTDSIGPDADAIPTLLMGTSEAEAMMLFDAAGEALYVSFINEVDSYCVRQGIDSRAVIGGLSFGVPTGGSNPSFGCEGTYLPDNTKRFIQKNPNFPKPIVDVLVAGDKARLDFVTSEVMRRIYRVVYSGKDVATLGLYRPNTAHCQTWSEHYLQSMIDHCKGRGIVFVAYDPEWDHPAVTGVEFIDDLEEFKRVSDVIATSRWSDDLSDVRDKVYTRDFGR